MLRSPARRDAFLRFLRQGVSVSAAAQAIGLSRTAMYNWRSDDEAFRTEWDDALATITENIESALAKAALGGDTVSMIFRLKSHKPEAYNRKQIVAIGSDENAPHRCCSSYSQSLICPKE
jgi:transposase-like protein